MSEKHNQDHHHLHFHQHSYGGTPQGCYPQHGITNQQPSCPPIHQPGPEVQPQQHQSYGHHPVFVNSAPIVPPPRVYEPQHHHHVPQGPPSYVSHGPPSYVNQAPNPHGGVQVLPACMPETPPSYVNQGRPPCVSHVPQVPLPCEPEKKPKKKGKELKKALALGLPVLALGVGAYAIGKSHGKASDTESE